MYLTSSVPHLPYAHKSGKVRSEPIGVNYFNLHIAMQRVLHSTGCFMGISQIASFPTANDLVLVRTTSPLVDVYMQKDHYHTLRSFLSMIVV
jgi:hypothetical protein